MSRAHAKVQSPGRRLGTFQRHEPLVATPVSVSIGIRSLEWVPELGQIPTASAKSARADGHTLTAH